MRGVEGDVHISWRVAVLTTSFFVFGCGAVRMGGVCAARTVAAVKVAENWKNLDLTF